MTKTLEQLKVVCGPTLSISVPDEDLLEQFLHQEESMAFTELMRRHGSMVFGVCRRILGQHHDAEDAFQAVFLVLAQKAETISPRRQLAAWLHGVASRTALKVRSQIQKRRQREASLPDLEVMTHDRDPSAEECLTLLDEEVQQLPERYRLPILLCGLQGRSRQEVAQMLNWPEGTVAGRFHRAKEKLAQRLAKRGVSLSIAALSMVFSTQSASAKVPTSLLATTSHLVKVSRLGEMGTSFVHTLAEGVLQTMTMSKWKIAACWLGLISFIFGIGYMGPNLANAENQTTKSSTGNSIEPIQADLVLNEGIQKELRLSKNQVDKLKQAWEQGKTLAKEDIDQIKQLDQQINVLRDKLKKLSDQKSKLNESIYATRSKALKKSIVENLSGRAVQRLRQITLRQRGAMQLLLDPKIQASLSINDEQHKKLKELELKALNQNSNDFTQLWIPSGKVKKQSLNTLFVTEALAFNQEGQILLSVRSGLQDSEVLKILTPQQQKRWKQLLGEPYPPAWKKKK